MFTHSISKIQNSYTQIYAGRTQSETRRNQQLPSVDSNNSSPGFIGAVFSPPSLQQQVIPDVVPMRRGRPTAGGQGHTPKPSPSPLRGTNSDPFAALDSKSPPGPVDEISSRFPSLDEFSLLHDGGKFDFDKTSATKSKTSPPKPIAQRVTEKLADDAFALPARSKTPVPAPSAKSSSSSVVSRAQKIISSNPELQAVSSPPHPTIVYQPTPTRPINSSYVSQGTMTSPTPPPSGQPPVKYNPSPVSRFPQSSTHHRSSSLPRNQEAADSRTNFLRPEENQLLYPNTIPRNSSFTSQPHHARHASSSRPSLEGGRPSNEILDPVARTKSSNSRPRPASNYLDSNIDFLREKEAQGRPSLSDKRPLFIKPSDNVVLDPDSDEETNIESNVDFLRTMEDTEAAKKDRRRSSGPAGKSKRSSLPSMSLSGTKNLLAGKFGDAFKRFENNATAPPGPRTPSPLNDMERRDLTPIAGSEATDGRSDDGNILEDMDSMAPEQRREIERRRLSMEEKRVANAAAEYRKRLAERGPTAPKSIGGVSRAASIQNKVKTLLDENQGPSPIKKTAEGYGHYTDARPSPQQAQASRFEQSASASANPYAKPTIVRKPVVQGVGAGAGIVHARSAPPMQNNTNDHNLNFANPRSLNPNPSLPPLNQQSHPISSPATVSKTGGPRPHAPPKPMYLNSINTGPGLQNSSSPPKQGFGMQRGGGGGGGIGRGEMRQDMTPKEKEDYIADFSKRFPSLSGIEMVEREIEPGTGGERERGLRSKEV
jgi:AP2-associated kinase